MTKDQQREQEAARLIELARIALETEGDTIAGLVKATRASSRAQWEIDQIKDPGPMATITARAIGDVITAIDETAATADLNFFGELNAEMDEAKK